MGGLTTGQAVLRAAAATAEKVSVELGGDDSTLVLADTDLDGVVDDA